MTCHPRPPRVELDRPAITPLARAGILSLAEVQHHEHGRLHRVRIVTRHRPQRLEAELPVELNHRAIATSSGGGDTAESVMSREADLPALQQRP